MPPSLLMPPSLFMPPRERGETIDGNDGEAIREAISAKRMPEKRFDPRSDLTCPSESLEKRFDLSLREASPRSLEASRSLSLREAYEKRFDLSLREAVPTRSLDRRRYASYLWLDALV